MSWISTDWITRNDFVGRFNLPQSQFNDIDLTVEEVVEDYLVKLMGAEMYDTFFAQFDGTPSADYTALRDGETITNSNGDTFKYKGLKDMCLYFVMAELKGKFYQDSEDGSVITSHSNSNKVSIVQEKQISYNMYNKGVKLYNEARFYLYEKRLTFPAWKYRHITTKHLIN